MLEDPADVGQKPHVEHPVGLVEDQILEPVELGIGKPEMVEQPARGRHDDIDAGPEGVLLGSHPDPAEDRRAGDRGMHRQIIQILGDLGRQFPGGRQHQGPGAAAGPVDQLVDDRQQKRGGLPAPGHGAGEQVPAFEGRRNGVGLDRGGSGKAQLLDGTEQTGMQ